MLEHTMDTLVSIVDIKLDEVGMAIFLDVGESFMRQQYHLQWCPYLTEQLSLPLPVNHPHMQQLFDAACARRGCWGLSVAC